MVNTLTPEQFKTHILNHLKTRFDQAVVGTPWPEEQLPQLSWDRIWQNISAKVDREAIYFGGDEKNAPSKIFTLTSEKADKMAALFEGHYFGEEGLVKKLVSEIGKEANSDVEFQQKFSNILSLSLSSISSHPDHYGERITEIFADDVAKQGERIRNLYATLWRLEPEKMEAMIAKHVPAETRQAAEKVLRDTKGIRWGNVGGLAATVAVGAAALGGIGYLLFKDKGKKEEQPKTWTARVNAPQENSAQRGL